MSKTERKAALTMVATEMKLMVDDDLERVVKLANAELKSRTMLAKVVGELEAE